MQIISPSLQTSLVIQKQDWHFCMAALIFAYGFTIWCYFCFSNRGVSLKVQNKQSEIRSTGQTFIYTSILGYKIHVVQQILFFSRNKERERGRGKRRERKKRDLLLHNLFLESTALSELAMSCRLHVCSFGNFQCRCKLLKQVLKRNSVQLKSQVLSMNR